MKKQLVGMVTMVVVLYVVMTISSTVERSVSVKVGSHYSAEFAAEIQRLNNWRHELKNTDPVAAERASSMILFSRHCARASIAFLATVFVFGIAKLGAARRNKMMDENQRA